VVAGSWNLDEIPTLRSAVCSSSWHQNLETGMSNQVLN
jgi:hypothetical protein